MRVEGKSGVGKANSECGPKRLVAGTYIAIVGPANNRLSKGSQMNRKIILFGEGRVGRTIAAYLKFLGHNVRTVSRIEATRRDDDLRQAVHGDADVVAAAIPDDALARWRDVWARDFGAPTAIHFSGATVIDGVVGYHPLYSFPERPLAPETMGAIAIGREQGAKRFSSLFPGAANPEFEIAPADRAFYHALAVLSGNFAAHLFNRAALAFEARFEIDPAALLAPYLQSVAERFAENPMDSLTGPAARKDWRTVATNLESLKAEPELQTLYKAFLASAWPDYSDAGRRED